MDSIKVSFRAAMSERVTAHLQSLAQERGLTVEEFKQLALEGLRSIKPVRIHSEDAKSD